MASDGGIGGDPALLELFRAEMDTHVPVLSGGLLALEKGQAGEQDIDAMMRAAHSIKGAARIIGIDAAVRVAHVMEDCFTAARGKRIALGSDAVDVLLQGVDGLQRICQPQPDQEISEQFVQTLLDRIGEVRDGRAPARDPEARAGSTPASAVATNVPTIHAPATTITLPAVFDDRAAATLRNELAVILRSSAATIRIDFRQVEQLTAAALSLLLSLAREVARIEPAPVLEACGAGPRVRALLRVTGLHGALSILD